MSPAADEVPWRPLGDTGVHYWLVKRMAKTCDIDMVDAVESGDLQIEGWADLVRKCRSCTWVDGCTRWLDRNDQTDGAEPPANCINASLFRLLAEGQKE